MHEEANDTVQKNLLMNDGQKCNIGNLSLF